MPKSRPIRQPMSNPNLPDTGAMLVDLNAAGPEPPPRIVYGSSVPAIVGGSSAAPGAVFAHGTISPEVTVTPRSDAARLPPQSADDDYDDAIELKNAQQRAKERDRAKALESDNARVTQWGQEQANRAALATHALLEAQADTIETAITAAEGEAEQATQLWADAMAKGDYVTAGRENRKMMSAQGRIETLRAGKDELAAEVRKKPQAAAPPPPSMMNNVDVIISRMPNLIDSEREWIRQHPDSVENQENQLRMRTAFLDATKRNLTRGSDEYFAFFNERMGYEDDGGGEEEPVPQPRQAPRQNGGGPRVSAPVVRSGGGTLRPGQFLLTEKQREAARISGIDEVTYARGLQRMIEMKAQGMYGASEQK